MGRKKPSGAGLAKTTKGAPDYWAKSKARSDTTA